MMSECAPSDCGSNDIELEIYTLRSDLHRAIDFADRMRCELVELRRKLAERPNDPFSEALVAQDAKLLYQAIWGLRSELEDRSKSLEEARETNEVLLQRLNGLQQT